VRDLHRADPQTERVPHGFRGLGTTKVVVIYPHWLKDLKEICVAVHQPQRSTNHKRAPTRVLWVSGVK